MLSVWTSNAGHFEGDATLASLPFHRTAAIDGFLDSDGHKFFVCGLKGVGKTLLLKMKSAEARRSNPGVTFLPATELVETMRPIVHSMSYSELADLRSPIGWSRLWEVVLAVVIIKRQNLKMPAPVVDVFPELEDCSIRYHIDRLLHISPNDRRRLIEDFLAPLQATLRQIHHGVHLFVDAIDDCVLAHAGASLKDHLKRRTTQFGVQSFGIWTAAQVGFLQAAVGLNANHRHIRVYGALRREALELAELSDRQNLEPYLLTLEYSRSHLRDIFVTKLRALRERSPSAFADPMAPDLIEGFFGFKTIPHPTVRDGEHPLEEQVFDYLLRHTRGRPRELDMLGESLELIDSRPRTYDEVRRRVRERSCIWFDWAKTEALPHWGDINEGPDTIDAMLNRIGTNFLTRDECLRLSNIDISEANLGRDPFYTLFSVGLLGCVVTFNGRLLQLFRQGDPEMPIGKFEYLAAKRYAVHPCVNLATIAQKDDYQPDLLSVAGHGYPFVERPRLLHLHFGAGAIGVGLILPLLAANKLVRICVVQRRTNSSGSKDKWSRFPGTGREYRLAIRKRVPGSAVAESVSYLKAHTVDDDATDAEFNAAVDQWTRGGLALFLLTDREDRIAGVLNRATTISFSLKSNKSVEQVTSNILAYGGSVVGVYSFENDNSLYRQAAQALRHRVPVISSSVDRICTSDAPTDSGISVMTEDYLRVVINDESPISRLLFGVRPKDQRGRSGEQSVYFMSDSVKFEHERAVKQFLVNGMHFANAVYANLVVQESYGDDPETTQILLEGTYAQLLAQTQGVQDALDEIKEIFHLHLLVEAEARGLISADADVDEHLRFLQAISGTFAERLVTTRDRVTRILEQRIEAVNRKVQRFVETLNGLGGRFAKTRIVFGRLSRSGWSVEAVDRAVTKYRADCLVLMRYIELGNKGALPQATPS